MAGKFVYTAVHVRFLSHGTDIMAHMIKNCAGENINLWHISAGETFHLVPWMFHGSGLELALVWQSIECCLTHWSCTQELKWESWDFGFWGTSTTMDCNRNTNQIHFLPNQQRIGLLQYQHRCVDKVIVKGGMKVLDFCTSYTIVTAVTSSNQLLKTIICKYKWKCRSSCL